MQRGYLAWSMADSSSSAATNDDIKLLKESVSLVKDDVKLLREDGKSLTGHMMDQLGRMYDTNERWKDEIIKETKHHFDVSVENFNDAHRDRLGDHDMRITRLEQHTRIRTA